MVVGGEPRVAQQLGLLRSQHAKSGAHLHAQRPDLRNHVQHLTKLAWSHLPRR